MSVIITGVGEKGMDPGFTIEDVGTRTLLLQCGLYEESVLIPMESIPQITEVLERIYESYVMGEFDEPV